ncbi:MAG: T9SS type A sorting domain-containing protein [Bacteroidia bacterium]
MKKFLLALIICCNSISLSAQTSVYHPFPDSSASWNYSYGNVCWGIFSNSAIDYYNSYYVGSDTLINNLSYHSFQIPAIVYHAGPDCTPPGYYVLPGKYAGAFRNDHLNKKVYIVPEADSIEQLLFDFDMQVGDSLKGFLSVCAPNVSCDIVISIDSVLVGNSYRKRWFVNPYYNVYFIEGIGSTYGLLRYIPANMTDHDGINLDCFSQNGQPLYPDTLGSCPLLTSIATLPSAEIIIKVHPNPSIGNLQVELSSTKNIERWVLHNLNGQMERTDIVQNKNQFEINGILPGFYILTLVLEDGRKIIRKIVVI